MKCEKYNKWERENGGKKTRIQQGDERLMNGEIEDISRKRWGEGKRRTKIAHNAVYTCSALQ